MFFRGIPRKGIDAEFSSDFGESELDPSDADYDQEAQFKTSRQNKKKVKYSTSSRFTALPPPPATFAVPLPPQEVSGILQGPQAQKLYSVPILQEQATDVEDLCQADAEDDASQQAEETIDGDVDIETNLDALISLPLKHVLVDSTEVVLHPRVPDGHSVAPSSAVSNDDFSLTHNVPCVLEPLDNVPTDIYEELDVSMMATTPPAHKFHEEKSDDNAIRYCLARKSRARRQATGSVTKRAEIYFISSFKSPTRL